MKKVIVVGWPIKHSLSPRLHNYWIRKYSVDGKYDFCAVEPKEFDVFFSSFSDSEYIGANITVPYKERVVDKVDVLDSLAQKVGAVNTLLVRDKCVYGYNTDVFGFVENVKQNVEGDFDFQGSRVLLLGAGGASKAIIVGLIEEGVKKVFLSNRTYEKAVLLKEQFGEVVELVRWEEKEKVLSDINLLINSTSLGMDEINPLQINLEKLKASAVVTDIVYSPLITPLLQDAQARGNRVVDGLGMLLYQAVDGFEKWFGIKPEVTKELRREVLSR